ncbi:MAG: metal ABC transporter permease [Actinomycetota bacterium]|nr:metal ABC transporter permease [Actinomycetota bacterium]
MLDAITDPFAGEIGRRALAEVVLLGLVCGPLGAWVVLFRQSYAAESLAHAALPGLVLASLAGAPLLVGAAGGLGVAAVAIGLAGREQRVGPDTAIAVVVTTLFGAGVVLALQPEVPARLGEILFGDPLSVSGSDLAATAALGAVIAAALLGLHRRLALAGFDRQAARSLGIKPELLEFVLLALLAAATLVAVGALGNLLVVAMLLAPGAAALRLARGLPASLALAAVLAVGAGVAGLYVSFHLELAAGASIALAAVATFALAAAAAPLRRG